MYLSAGHTAAACTPTASEWMKQASTKDENMHLRVFGERKGRDVGLFAHIETRDTYPQRHAEAMSAACRMSNTHSRC